MASPGGAASPHTMRCDRSSVFHPGQTISTPLAIRCLSPWNRLEWHSTRAISEPPRPATNLVDTPGLYLVALDNLAILASSLVVLTTPGFIDPSVRTTPPQSLVLSSRLDPLGHPCLSFKIRPGPLPSLANQRVLLQVRIPWQSQNKSYSAVSLAQE